jgi:hypothetical protein
MQRCSFVIGLAGAVDRTCYGLKLHLIKYDFQSWLLGLEDQSFNWYTDKLKEKELHLGI